jgi:hypothetical protein
MPVEKREFQTVRVAFIGMDGKHMSLQNSDMPTRLVFISGASQLPRLYKIGVFALVT